MLPWFFHRPILLEMGTCLSALGSALAYVIINKNPSDENYRLKLGAIGVATLAYLLIPETVRLIPPQIVWRSALERRARALPRKSKTWEDATRTCGPATNEQYVVIGGAGFIGHRIVHALRLRGERRIRVVDVDKTALDEMKKMYSESFDYIVAEITDREAMMRVMTGANCVYAPVSVIRYWEVYQKHWPRSLKVNVDGMRNIVEACLAHGVSRLVTTGSSAAIEAWPGYEPEGIDDFTPRVTEKNYLANYMLSKSLQEQVALPANGRNNLAVSCIRPCSSVWGYGDKLALGIGIKSGMYPCLSATNAVDFVHVDVVVLAHLLLEAKLRNGPQDPAAGQAYCISNGEALEEGVFSVLLEQAAKANGIKMKVAFLPSRIVWVLSFFMSVFDYIYPGDTCKLLGRDLGMLTVPTVLNASHSLVVRNMNRAKELFGFEPHISIGAAADRTMEEYRRGEIMM